MGSLSIEIMWSLACDVLISEDLIRFDHDARDIAPKNITTVITFSKPIESSRLVKTRSIFNNWWGCASSDLIRGCSLHGLELSLRQHHGLIRDCLDLHRELLNAILTLLKCLVKLLINEDVILIAVLQIGILLLQCLEIVASSL